MPCSFSMSISFMSPQTVFSKRQKERRKIATALPNACGASARQKRLHNGGRCLPHFSKSPAREKFPAPSMRILLQDKKTGLYFDKSGVLTHEIEAAEDFATSQ